jgi:hypothetical protein
MRMRKSAHDVTSINKWSFMKSVTYLSTKLATNAPKTGKRNAFIVIYTVLCIFCYYFLNAFIKTCIYTPKSVFPFAILVAADVDFFVESGSRDSHVIVM